MKTAQYESIIYIEIPRGKSSPIKLDVLLEQRMRQFLWSRSARLVSFEKN